MLPGSISPAVQAELGLSRTICVERQLIAAPGTLFSCFTLYYP